MREVLFRGKSKKDGEWYTGSLLKENHERTNEKTEIYKIKEFNIGFLSEWTFEPTYTSGFDEEVLPDTIGQYTGLCDKNGKKIFEGDILSTDIERPYLIVEFRDGCFMFNCNDGGEDYYDIMLPILKEPQTQYEYGEIIGNIHDNPELLKGGEG